MAARPCKRCDEKGSVTCTRCKGTGEIYTGFYRDDESRKECPRCSGSGEMQCPRCEGSGTID
jgi:DnaJ-class molecular chaperone